MELLEPPADYPYQRVLDEIAQAGYAGSELGPYGFLPSEPRCLKEELGKRKLILCAAFVAMHLGDAGAHDDGFAHVTRTANLLQQVGCRLLVLSDEVTPARMAAAGRPEAAHQHSWSPQEWKATEQAIRRVVAICREKGLSVAFHHHVGTHVETPDEVDRLFSLFSPDELGLCLDTGHCLYGGGDPVAELDRYATRLRHLHFKDIDAARLDEVRQRRLSFYDAVRHGVFAPLGQGNIAFARVVDILREKQFGGWIVAEQDVLEGGRGASTPLANAMAGRRFLSDLGI
jgi:inosose dehydratase